MAKTYYSKHVRNEVIWAIPPTPHRLSSELQPAEAIDLRLQSSWKVVQRAGNSFTEELKPVSNLSTLQSKHFLLFFGSLCFLEPHNQNKLSYFPLKNAEGDTHYRCYHVVLLSIEIQ